MLLHKADVLSRSRSVRGESGLVKSEKRCPIFVDVGAAVVVVVCSIRAISAQTALRQLDSAEMSTSVPGSSLEAKQ